jgi:hypothetical protein
MSELCNFWVEVEKSNFRRSNQKIETLFCSFDQKILKALGGHYFRVFSYFTSPYQSWKWFVLLKRGLLILGNLTLRSLPQLLIVALFFTYISISTFSLITFVIIIRVKKWTEKNVGSISASIYLWFIRTVIRKMK